MKKISDRVQIAVFVSFIGIFSLLNLILPDKAFSERENRVLQPAPKFSLYSLFSGKFTAEFENYTTDQFALRDAWTTLKARAEILSGKRENNGVYLCEDDTLIERFEFTTPGQADKNISAVNAFTKVAGIDVYFALIPGAAEIWSDRLPENAPNYSQAELIVRAYSESGAKNVDMLGALSEYSSEYIFYGTDHHWTSLGAYYGYTALMKAMGMSADPIESFDRKTVSASFYGTVYSTSGISWSPPDSIEIFAEPGGDVSYERYESASVTVPGKIYDESFLEKKDKYSMFMGGNAPLEIIRTGVSEAPKLLVIRDSYMDSLTPFLLTSFSALHIIDLRYYRDGVKKYMAENDIDAVLVCYSAVNFVSDSSIPLLNA
jgi:hypothetical protein